MLRDRLQHTLEESWLWDTQHVLYTIEGQGGSKHYSAVTAKFGAYLECVVNAF